MLRRGVWFLGGFGLFIACSPRPAQHATVAAPNATTLGAAVTGVVIDAKTSRPLSGELVTDGSAAATTDASGHFALAHAASTYDLTLVSPDRSRVTIYRRLTRREVRLTATGTPSKPALHATIDGTLTGPLAPGSLNMHFLGAGGVQAYTLVQVKEGATATPYSLTVDWDGTATLSGELLALQLPGFHSDAASSFARTRTALTAGQPTHVDLALAPVPSVTREQSRATIDGPNVSTRSVSNEYYLPGFGLVFAACGPFRPGVQFKCADPNALGAVFCTHAFVYSPYQRSTQTRCAQSANEPLSMHLLAGPRFVRPAWGVAPALGLVFEWTHLERAIYRLTLQPNHASQDVNAPTPAHPQIEIVTAAQSDAWPDLEANGVSLPKSPAAYLVTVSALGPFTNVDEAVKPDPELIPVESWRATSMDLGLVLGQPNPLDMPEQEPELPPELATPPDPNNP